MYPDMPDYAGMKLDRDTANAMAMFWRRGYDLRNLSDSIDARRLVRAMQRAEVVLSLHASGRWAVLKGSNAITNSSPDEVRKIVALKVANATQEKILAAALLMAEESYDPPLNFEKLTTRLVALSRRGELD